MTRARRIPFAGAAATTALLIGADRLRAPDPAIADVRSLRRRGSLLLARPNEVVDFVRARARIA